MPFLTRVRHAAGILAVLGGLLACGGGSPKTVTATVSPFSLSIPTVSLEIGQSATATVTVTRTSTFTDAVALSVVASTLPSGVKVSLASASVTGTTDEVTVQAGYPDSSDATDATMVLPAAGTYSVTLSGVGSGTTVTTTLHLTVTSATKGFGLAWVDSDYYLEDATVLTLPKATATTLNFAPYNTSSLVSYATGTTAALGTSGLPSGLTVAFGDNPAELDYVTTVTLTPASTMADGTYTFYLTATVGSTTHYLPVEVFISSTSFWIQAPAAVKVVQGGTLTVPVSLGRNGTYFKDTGGDDPAYQGTLALAAGSASGLTAAFDTPATTTLASANLTIDASLAAAGTYTLPLTASRTNGTTTTSSTSIAVTVTASTASGTYWLQNLEWGQTVLKPGLRLIPGKAAKLVAQILADRSGVAAPAFTATLKNAAGATLDTLTLAGPATLPTSLAEGDLANAFTVTVPAADVVSGMTVTLSGGTLAQVLSPTVEDTGYQLDLVLVPIIHKSVAPVLPAASDIVTAVKAVWPVKTVATTERAAYTTSTIIATPPVTGSTATDYSSYGWAAILDELTALRAVDGSKASYYGFIDLSLPSTWKGSSIVGLHWQGEGVGMGIDETTGARFGTGENVVVMTHELGHGFNLGHTPGGGAAYPQMNYPYAGGGIGTWGYNPATSKAFSPATCFDIMTYLDTLWVSDWNYLAALNFIDSIGVRGSTFVSAADVAGTATRTLVTGWISPGGAIHLSPTELVAGAALTPRTGTHVLAVARASGSSTVQFGAVQTQDLPEGFRHFAFTLEGTEEIQSLEVRQASGAALRRTPRATAAVRRAALEQDAASGSLTAVEASGQLNLAWNATANPYATVLHVGTTTTALALRLTGGTASLPLAQVPAGGYFLVRLSDGLNPLEVKVARD